MPNKIKDRAFVFQPFDALRGFRECLSEKEELIEEPKVLMADQCERLDEIIRCLVKGMLIEVTYYDGKKYRVIKGELQKINISGLSFIQLQDQKIVLKDVIAITCEDMFFDE